MPHHQRLTDDQASVVVSQANEQLVSGAAPNLTHLMSRTVFAGATYNAEATRTARATCRASRRAHRSSASTPTLVGLAAQPTGAHTDGRRPERNGQYRGMPNLGLSEPQIAQLVAYLATLK